MNSSCLLVCQEKKLLTKNETMLSDLIDDAWQEMVVGGEGRAREIQQLILQKFDV
jgi:hypothetical protein